MVLGKGLPTKDDTSETIVRNWFNLFIVGQNWHISVLNHSVNHHSTQLNTETKNRAVGNPIGILQLIFP